MIKIERILFPTDFSEFANHARDYVVEMARKFGAKVLVVHVLATPAYAVSYEIAVDVNALREQLQKAAEKRMAEVQAKFDADGIDVETVIEVGAGFVQIVVTARNRDIDMIIMATHGWGGVKHLLLGSTAEKVVRKAPCPVLTIRHPDHEFIHP